MTYKFTVAVVLAVIVSAGIATARGRGQAPRTNKDQSDLVDAKRRGGLHEAAKAAGGRYVTKMASVPDFIVADVHALVRGSEAIVVADIAKNVSHLSRDGRYATTDYNATVTETLSGSLNPGDSFVLSVVGGLVKFADGTEAQVNVPDFERPLQGDRLVLFLRKVRPENTAADLQGFAGTKPILQPVAGALGVFSLPDSSDGKVKSRSRKTQPVVTQSKDKNTEDFLKDVRNALKDVEKEKKTQ